MDLFQSKSLPKPRILNQIWKKLRCPIPAKSFRGGFVSEGAIHIQNRHGHMQATGLIFCFVRSVLYAQLSGNTATVDLFRFLKVWEESPKVCKQLVGPHA